MPTSEPYRLIVVANRTCPCPGLVDEIGRRVTGRDEDVLILAPALNSRLRHFLTDVDGAVLAAEGRVEAALGLLRAAGIRARGAVGDADPLHALEDAHAEFMADAVLISTWPQGRSHWLERDLPQRARERLSVPVDHVASFYDLAAAPGEVPLATA